MKTKFVLAIALAGLCIAASPLAAQTAKPAAAPQAAQLPAPKILVVDRTALFEQSKAGQDILNQVKAYTDAAEKDIRGRSAALQAEGQQLQQQVAILSPDAKAKKVKDFEDRQAALQNAAQQKQAMIQGGFVKARSQLEAQLGPILQGLLAQRGANLLLDKGSVVMANSNGFDVTGVAIDLLNQKVSKIKVDLVALPAGANAPQ